MATTTTTTCEIPGHPDTYGLGIRLAFYVQWFGLVVLTSCSAGIGAAAALELHFLHGLTTAAAAVGLAININNGLAPAEVLVVLVLACGALYFWVPVYVWRLATCCRQWCKYVCSTPFFPFSSAPPPPPMYERNHVC